MNKPLISICIPVYDMEDKSFFLDRCTRSIERQTYKNYEIVIAENGRGMAGNTNDAIKRATGDIIKILFMDDYLAHNDALQNLVDSFTGGWLACGCLHDDGQTKERPHMPEWNDDIHVVNTIGSPSVIAFENNDPLLFDENLSWMLDTDLYKRLHARYGPPTMLESIDVVIGIGEHQHTNKLTDVEKLQEHEILTERYE